MAPTTIQALLSHSRLLTQLITKWDGIRPVLTAPQTVIWDQIVSESRSLSLGLAGLGLTTGAGRFPNTFQKDGLYRYVFTSDQETAALLDGWRVATFPETMIKAGAPDLVVHDAVQKFEALELGYTLPGLT